MRRKRNELVQCFSCPRTHQGWKRSQLRNRKRTPYCPQHLAEIDARHQTWPACPTCKKETFILLSWLGSVEDTLLSCESCDFEAPAINYLDPITIKVLAKPIDVAIAKAKKRK